MPKNTRRISVQRTVTYTATIDVPGYPEESDANVIIAMGGAAGNTGTLSIAELLAGATLANAGIVSKGNWAATGTSTNIEPYITRPASTALSVGQRIASIAPPATYEAALGKLFVVTTAGTTAAGTTEPNWNLSDSLTTTDGGVTYRTIPKFPTLTTFVAATVYAIGTILRPAAGSLKEFLVTTATTAATTAPTWTTLEATVGGTPQALPGAGQVVCLTTCRTYAFNTVYALGDLVKPSAASAEEYLVTVAGTSDTTALSQTVGNSVTRGSATFKRII